MGPLAEQLELEEQLISNNTLRLDLSEREQSIRRQIEDSVQSVADREQEYNTLVLETRLSALQEIGALEEVSLIRAKQLLEDRKIELDIQQKQRNLTLDAARQIQDIETRIGRGGLTEEEYTALRDQQQQILNSLNAGLNLLRLEGNYRKTLLDLTSGLAIKEAERLKNIKNIAEQYSKVIETGKLLEDVFGGFLDKFGKTISELGQALQNDLDNRSKLEDEYNKKRLQAAEKYKEDQVATKNALIKLDQEQKEKSEKLDNDLFIKSSRSVKSLFNEKSTAYKVLSTLEKAAAIQTLALNAKILVSTLSSIGANLAAGAARLFAQGGFAGFAAVAGMTALVGSLVSKSFTRGSAGSQVSLESTQKAQLTGQVYENGTLVNARGALASDPQRKLESIKSSLEKIEEGFFEDLNYSNEMLKALRNIEENTLGLAEQLVISGKLNADIAQQTINNSNLSFDRTAKLGFGGLGAAGGFIVGKFAGAALANAFTSTAFASKLNSIVSSLIGKTVTGMGGAVVDVITSLGGPVGLAVGALLGSNLDKIVTSIFGGKVSSTVTDFGLAVSGTVGQLKDGTDTLVTAYTNLQTTISGGLFRDARTTTEKFVQQASDPVQEYVQVLFNNIATSVIEGGKILGTDVADKVKNFVIEPFEVSIKDKTPEEVAEALSNKTSLIFNDLVNNTFGNLIAALRKPLEESGTTFTRLVSQTQALDNVLKIFGKTAGEVGFELKATIANSLVSVFGDIKNLTDQVEFFKENFLTEAEQIAPIASSLKEEFAKLGVSSDLTRDQFKALVLQQNLATVSGQETFAALLNLQKGFDKVQDYLDTTRKKLEDFAKSIRDFIKAQIEDIIPAPQKTESLLKEFQSTAAKALSGDEESLGYLTTIAQKTIDSARNSSRSLREFNLLRAGIISSLDQVADKTEESGVSLLTPQQQANVYLENIQNNTTTLAQDIANAINDPITVASANQTVVDAVETSVQSVVDQIRYTDDSGQQGPGGDPSNPAMTSPAVVSAAISVAQATQGIVNAIQSNPGLMTIPGAGIVTAIHAVASSVADTAIAAMTAVEDAMNAAIAAENDLAAAAADGQYAKGGAFYKGIQMFESGAAFSNSVVNNPTMFPMGVMGEAGPEAIMPLTRTSDGSLGVTAEIPVVNNQEAVNAQLVQEIRNLKRELQMVRTGIETTAVGTNKTYRLFDRLTQNGESLQVTTVEGSVTSVSSLDGGTY